MLDLQLLFISISSKLFQSLYIKFRDLGHELTYLLEAEFNELYETNDVIKIETKIRNIRFLGELTKF